MKEVDPQIYQILDEKGKQEDDEILDEKSNQDEKRIFFFRRRRIFCIAKSSKDTCKIIEERDGPIRFRIVFRMDDDVFPLQ